MLQADVSPRYEVTGHAPDEDQDHTSAMVPLNDATHATINLRLPDNTAIVNDYLHSTAIAIVSEYTWASEFNGGERGS